MAHQYPSATRAWYLVILLTIAYVFSFVDKYIPALLVEPLKQDLGISDTQMGLLLGPAFAVLYALIYLRVNGEAVAVDARPSDAIALALRARAPIFVEESVIEGARNAASSKRAVKKPATTASGAVTAANAMVLRKASQKAGPVTTCR